MEVGAGGAGAAAAETGGAEAAGLVGADPKLKLAGAPVVAEGAGGAKEGNAGEDFAVKTPKGEEVVGAGFESSGFVKDEPNEKLGACFTGLVAAGPNPENTGIFEVCRRQN